MSLSAHLTHVLPPEIEAQHRASVPGMAHFALTGPAGRTCRECVNWGRGKKKFARDCGDLKPCRCAKFRSLMHGVEGDGVPHDTPSCKFFAARDNPPHLDPAWRVTPEERKARRAKK